MCVLCLSIDARFTNHQIQHPFWQVDPASMRLNYDLAEASGGLLEKDVASDPLAQFDR